MKRMVLVFLIFSNIILANVVELDWDKVIEKNKLIYDKKTNLLFTGKRIKRYKNKSVQYEVEYQNGKLNGWNKGYYRNGSLWYSVHYKNGLKNGMSYKYYKNNQIKYIREYAKDKAKDGIYYNYNKDGFIKESFTYKGGKLNGEYINYYLDGEERFTLNMINGYTKDGFDYEGKDKDGKLVAISTNPLMEVQFENISIENLVRWYLNKEGIKTDKILDVDLNKIKSLYLSDENISDIQDLSKLKKLEILDISHNPIKKIDLENLINKLPNLKKINISGLGYNIKTFKNLNIINIPDINLDEKTKKFIEKTSYKIYCQNTPTSKFSEEKFDENLNIIFNKIFFKYITSFDYNNNYCYICITSKLPFTYGMPSWRYHFDLLFKFNKINNKWELFDKKNIYDSSNNISNDEYIKKINPELYIWIKERIISNGKFENLTHYTISNLKGNKLYIWNSKTDLNTDENPYFKYEDIDLDGNLELVETFNTTDNNKHEKIFEISNDKVKKISDTVSLWEVNWNQVNDIEGIIYDSYYDLPFTGRRIKRDKSGNLQCSAEYKNGILDGEYILYDENGEKKIVVYKKGKPIKK